MDVLINLIVVIISQRDYTLNHHIVQSFKIHLFCSPPILLPSIYPREMKKKVCKDISINIHRDFVQNSQKSENKPNVHQQINKLQYIHVREYYLKKITIDPCSNLTGFQRDLDEKSTYYVIQFKFLKHLNYSESLEPKEAYCYPNRVRGSLR